MKKYIKDGCVGVLYSPNFGAGWSSWNSGYERILCMDYDIVKTVDEGDKEKAIKIALDKCPDIYTGGGKSLTIEWVPLGQMFRITEYDGYESVEIFSDNSYMHTLDEEEIKELQLNKEEIKRTLSLKKDFSND